MRLSELAAQAEALEPVFHKQTDAGFICLLAWAEGWSIGVSHEPASSLQAARKNALATMMQQL